MSALFFSGKQEQRSRRHKDQRQYYFYLKINRLLSEENPVIYFKNDPHHWQINRLLM